MNNPDFSRIEKNFKKALWFGIDSNDIVEINALNSLASLDLIIQEQENEFKKLKEDLNYFIWKQTSNTPKRFYGEILLKVYENISFTEDNLNYLLLYFKIVQNLPADVETPTNANLQSLVFYLTQRFMKVSYNTEALLHNDSLQLALFHILNLYEWNIQFKQKFPSKKNDEFFDQLRETQVNEFKKNYDQNKTNVKEFKYFIYKQKSECLTLSKLQGKDIERLFQNPIEIAMLYLNYVYLSNKDFDGKEKILGAVTDINFLETYQKGQDFQRSFLIELRKELFKQFDY